VGGSRGKNMKRGSYSVTLETHSFTEKFHVAKILTKEAKGKSFEKEN